MIRFAVISDIHSNIYALRAVLEDITLKNIDAVYCAGDLVGYGPFPNEVTELIRGKGIPTVMGNYDDAVANMRFTCGCDYKDAKAQELGEISINWTKENATEENKAFLRNLPKEIRFAEGKYRVLIVHGSPRALNEYISKDSDYMFLAESLVEGDCDILICGHTHIPFHEPICNKHIINAGSVGKPKHGSPNATYVVVTITDNKVETEFAEVAYDVEACARAIEDAGLPVEFAQMLKTGRG